MSEGSGGKVDREVFGGRRLFQTNAARWVALEPNDGFWPIVEP